ncbi:hypothetical protein DespoDRAFT_03325 [Desulfobacter postgatei 2ac9]|uniref:Uncharacterized protein n=1 Tax=Desulfobacter postgatei 2ac9 TaxID=879212 RepID=I5B6I7_9BACT|nr:hypothetical protein DespoDRAFT_03325 [Desulfobacter postgatei 2ac9]
MGRNLKSSVDISSVSYPQNDNITTLNIKNYSIISNSESICSELGVYKCLGISMRILFVARQRLPDSFFYFRSELFDILLGSVSVYEGCTLLPENLIM